jgi:chromate transporter
MLFLKTLFTVAILWHLFAFAAGGVYVFHAYRVLFFGGYNPAGLKIIRTADVHLWLSGFTVIGLGVLIDGISPYFANPKLLAKLVLIVIWLFSTQLIRRYAVKRMREGNRAPMLVASSINVTCWIYGAFLGVAKPLVLNGYTFGQFLVGFDVVFACCLVATLLLESKHTAKLNAKKADA